MEELQEITRETLDAGMSFEELLDFRYGKIGTPLRDKFEKKMNKLFKKPKKKSNPYYHSKRKFK